MMIHNHQTNLGNEAKQMIDSLGLWIIFSSSSRLNHKTNKKLSAKNYLAWASDMITMNPTGNHIFVPL